MAILAFIFALICILAIFRLRVSHVIPALISENSQCSEFLGRLPIGILFRDASGKVIFANKTLNEILLRANASKVSTDAEIISMLNNLYTSQSGVIEIQCNGKNRWLERETFPLKQGRKTLEIDLFIDVTDKRAAIDLSQHFQTQYTVAFHESPQAKFMVEASTLVIHDLNRAAISMLGVTRTTLRKTLFSELPIWPEDGTNLEGVLKNPNSVELNGISCFYLAEGNRKCKSTLYAYRFIHNGSAWYQISLADNRSTQKLEELEKSVTHFFHHLCRDKQIAVAVVALNDGRVQVLQKSPSFSKLILERQDFTRGGFRVLDANILKKTLEINAPIEREFLIGQRLYLQQCIPFMEDGHAKIVVFNQRAQEYDRLRSVEQELTEKNSILINKTRYLQSEISAMGPFLEFVGASASSRALVEKIRQVAPLDTSVLILGESGSGKQLVAREIHRASQRSNDTFVHVNVAAITPSLFESEFFGHEKGAFTGADRQKKGRFELAENGTLFLDEIAELPLDMQAKLLHVLQEREFERVGGSEKIKANVRIVTATNRDLLSMVKTGYFREDLYFRLMVFPIEVPPLRERKGDLLELIQFYVAFHSEKAGKDIERITRASVQALLEYDWPGNVRELQNVLERSIILSDSNTLEIPDSVFQSARRSSNPSTYELCTLEQLERSHILSVLDHCDGKISGRDGASTVLGLNPNTLRSRMQKLGIERVGERFVHVVH